MFWWLPNCCGDWICKPVNRTSMLTVVTPTDRPGRSEIVVKLLVTSWCCYFLPIGCSDLVGFIIFSLNLHACKYLIFMQNSSDTNAWCIKERETYLKVSIALCLSKIKVPRGIQGEKSSKDMVSSRNVISKIGAQASPKKGDGTRCPEG